jgi:molybdopterin-dependent oxidoreductase alpha subunit
MRGTPLADQYLQIRVGGDLALFAAIGSLLLRWNAVDQSFVSEYTSGFDEYAAARRELDWDLVRESTGLTRDEIETLARRFADSPATIVCWAMGLTQQKNSVPTIREIVNVQLLRGMIGKPGAGLCPVRGHSNVQGDRTMGIVERPPAWSARLTEALGIAVPSRHGYDTVGAIRAMRDGRASVFMSLGGNFAAAAPDTEVTAAALRSCRLTVHVSTKLNRSHTLPGETSLVLPCLGRTETDPAGFVTVEDSMSSVHASRGALPPASPELLSEIAIVCRLARAVLGAGEPWDRFESDYREVRTAIAAVVPGFSGYEEKVGQPGGFTLPHGARDSRTFVTATERARFTVNNLAVLRIPPGRLLLQTMRSHDQYNTTIYGLDDRYRGIYGGRRVVLVNPADLDALGVPDGSTVDICSEWPDGRSRRATAFRVVGYPIARGCAGAYFPEANVLVPLDSTADGSNTPTSKQVIIRLDPTGNTGAG